jgi:hypothetical protein
MAVAARPASNLTLALLIAAAILAVLGISASLGIGPPLAASIAHADSSLALPACSDGFVMDFAGLPAGTILGEQYASRGVHISGLANGAGFPHAIIVFNSNGSASHDRDLEVDVGNIAILAKNLNGAEGDGVVDDADENNYGGKQIYVFDHPVYIGSFLFIDKDHGTPDRAIAYGASNNIITQVPIQVAGNGSVERIDVDAGDVSRLIIDYRDSGGLTGIQVCPQTAETPDPTPTVSPSPKPSATPVASSTELPVQPAAPTAGPSSPAPAVLAAALPATGGKLGSAAPSTGEVGIAAGALATFMLGVVAIARSQRKQRD